MSEGGATGVSLGDALDATYSTAAQGGSCAITTVVWFVEGVCFLEIDQPASSDVRVCTIVVLIVCLVAASRLDRLLG